MMGDYQVRFCERLGGVTPPCLLGAIAVVVGFLFGQPRIFAENPDICTRVDLLDRLWAK